MKNSQVTVNFRKLDDNIRALRAALRPETEPMFVVKANAYGHGMVPIAMRAAAAGIKWFCVAHVEEALALRAKLKDAQILVLGYVAASDIRILVEQRIVPVVVGVEEGLALAAAAKLVGATLPVHLKIDTGMGRFGVPWESALDAFKTLARESNLNIQGLCTHFASVELKKPSLGPTQMERFRDVSEQIIRYAGRKFFRHASSSRAFLYHKEWDLDGVRPGILLYGYGAGERGMRIRTSPILEWRTQVLQVKRVPAGFPVGYYSMYTTPAPTMIATIAVGYADGYQRALSNKGFVLLGGRRCAVIGRISMNWITVDAGPDSTAKAGDEVVLIGQQGEASIWADELARLARTIPYEILTSINPLADRLYIA